MEMNALEAGELYQIHRRGSTERPYLLGTFVGLIPLKKARSLGFLNGVTVHPSDTSLAKFKRVCDFEESDLEESHGIPYMFCGTSKKHSAFGLDYEFGQPTDEDEVDYEMFIEKEHPKRSYTIKRRSPSVSVLNSEPLYSYTKPQLISYKNPFKGATEVVEADVIRLTRMDELDGPLYVKLFKSNGETGFKRVVSLEHRGDIHIQIEQIGGLFMHNDNDIKRDYGEARANRIIEQTPHLPHRFAHNSDFIQVQHVPPAYCRIHQSSNNAFHAWVPLICLYKLRAHGALNPKRKTRVKYSKKNKI